MGADVLIMQEARASATMIMTMFFLLLLFH